MNNHQLSLLTKVISLILLGILPVIIGIVFNLSNFHVLLLVIISSLSSTLLAYLIFKPLKLLQRQIENLSNGLDQVPIPIKTNDELEQLHLKASLIDSRLKELKQNLLATTNLASASNSKLNTILYSISDGVLAVDLNYQVIGINKAAQNITGLAQEQSIGQRIDQLFLIADESHTLSLNEYCPINLDSQGGIIFSKPDLKLTIGKKEIYINLTVGQIKETKESNLGAILIFSDTSKSKELDQMQYDFVSMAAHELRTPLTALRGYLSVMLQEGKDALDKPPEITSKAPPLNSEQVMFLTRMDISAKQLMSLVENLLNVSKIERGVFNVNLEEIDWASFVQQAINDQLDRAKDKNIDLSFIAPALPLPKIKADKLRIGEVLTNLISNAINYTQAGGKIVIWAESSGQEITTHVRDTGIGIPKEALKKLFGKFFRAENTLHHSKGTGLGLYITKAIVDLHHGKIWVESEVGKGSTFSFSIPTTQNTTNPMQQGGYRGN